MNSRVRRRLLPALSAILPALLPTSAFADQLFLTPQVPGSSQFVINDPTIWYSQTLDATVAPTPADDLEVDASTLIADGSLPPIVILLDDHYGRVLLTSTVNSLVIDGPLGLSISRDGSWDFKLILGDGTALTSVLYMQNASVNLSANLTVLGIASLADQLTLQQSTNLELTTFSAKGLQLAGGNPAVGVFTHGSLVVGANTDAEIDGTVTILDGVAPTVISVSGNASNSGYFHASGIDSQALSTQTLLNVGPFGSVQVDGPITSSNSVGTLLNATGGITTLAAISLQEIGGTMISASGSAKVTAGITTFSGTAGGTLFAASGSAIITAGDVTGGPSSHLIGPLVSAVGQSAVTLGNVTLQDADAALIQSTSLGQVTVGDVFLNGIVGGEVINASQGAHVKLGKINFDSVGFNGQLLGPLVIAADPATYVQFGNVGDFLQPGNFFVLPSFSTTVISATGGANVAGGLLDLGSVDTPQAILVDGIATTLALDGLSIPSLTGTSIVVSGGAHLTIGKDAPYPDFGTLTHSVSPGGEEGALQISVTGNSLLNTPAGLEIQALHPSTMTVDHSEWDGGTNYAYDFESKGGANNATLIVRNGSVLNNFEFIFWYGVTASFDRSTLTNVSMNIQFGSQATVSNAIWKSQQVTNVGDNSINGGTYGGTGILNVSSSQLYDLIIFTAFNAGGDAHVTFDNMTVANTGQIQASVSSTVSGTSTITIRNQSQLWTYTSLDLGASKRADSFGFWPVITSSTGTAHLVLQTGSRAVVGGSVRADGSFSTFTSDTSVTLGDGSDISIDGTSAMYVGRITAPGQAIFNNGALTLGHAGYIFGNGTINANLINIGGVLSPGFSPGHLTIDGSYVQNAGEVDIEIGGPGQGQYDQITASSFNFLGGKIVFSLYGSGYTGADLAGHTLTFFAGGTVNMSNTQFVDHTGLGVQLVNGSVTFPGTAVPEPASLAVLGLGAAALLRRRKQETGNAKG